MIIVTMMTMVTGQMMTGGGDGDDNSDAEDDNMIKAVTVTEPMAMCCGGDNAEDTAYVTGAKGECSCEMRQTRQRERESEREDRE